jgi:hypothetical protein
MLYTLAFNSVNTKLVFLSNPLNASKISADGVDASSDTTVFSYSDVSPQSPIARAVERRKCRGRRKERETRGDEHWEEGEKRVMGSIHC